MDKFSVNFHQRIDWSPGSRDLRWDRTIVAIDLQNRQIMLDAPLTMAMEERFGGGTVQKYDWPGRICNIGVENIKIVSDSDAANPKDEEHAWFGISLDNAEDAWVRSVTTRGLVSAGVVLGAGARAVTVEDCSIQAPTAELGGWRRLGIWNSGQLVLVQRCEVEESWHGLAPGHCAAGPNVYLDCLASKAIADATSFESWSSGTLYDNVRVQGAGFTLANLGSFNHHGAGWNAANSLLWNCSADHFRVENPPTASNSVISNKEIPSLYRQQLQNRLGKIPSIVREKKPEPHGLPIVSADSFPNRQETRQSQAFEIADGYFLLNRKVVFGRPIFCEWWKGSMIPQQVPQSDVSPILWAPASSASPLNLDEIARGLAEKKVSIYYFWPGLWYDRRREEHNLDARTNGDVCAPFFEMPWARSGTGTAFDGLSKYDLAKFNPYYWDRVVEMAQSCAKHGIFFLHHFYNVHNLLETGAHWVDFPWRPGNCIQDLGLPDLEPGGLRVRVVNPFFDISNPKLRALHRLYIRKGLDAFKDQSNVIHTVAFQYVGPIAFQKFFLDTVAEWEKETKRKARVALITSKEQTDAILADPLQSSRIDVIDLTWWRYLPDGTLFAPVSGKGEAFRTQRGAGPKKIMQPTTAGMIYRQVREYRDRFPQKAIICPPSGTGVLPVLMAGGTSLAPHLLGLPHKQKGKQDDAALFEFIQTRLSGHLKNMNPIDGIADAWCLGREGESYLFYSPGGDTIRLERPIDFAHFSALWVNLENGKTQTENLATACIIPKPTSGAWLLFISAQASSR